MTSLDSVYQSPETGKLRESFAHMKKAFLLFSGKLPVIGVNLYSCRHYKVSLNHRLWSR